MSMPKNYVQTADAVLSAFDDLHAEGHELRAVAYAALATAQSVVDMLDGAGAAMTALARLSQVGDSAGNSTAINQN